MPAASGGDVTRLLHAWSVGDRDALEQLTPLVYRELRKLAASYLRRERSDHTLQPTALVNEAWIRLNGQAPAESQTRSRFFAIAANLMRQILVDDARNRAALKRGSGARVEWNDDAASIGPRDIDFIALDQALTRLSALEPRQAQIVELRFFAGLTEQEIAQVLGLSEITVKRGWRVARAMLYRELRITPQA